MVEPITASKYWDRGLSHSLANRELPRHRWYDFKESFSHQLVEDAIAQARGRGRRLRLLDPFCGSGTTLVAAGGRGHAATGIEVNPFLAFASRAKCIRGPWRRARFEAQVDTVMAQSRHEIPSQLEGVSTFTERPGATRWLFNRSVLRGFASLDRALVHAGSYGGPLRLALFSSLMECCNAKRDGKCLRYRKEWDTCGWSSSDLRDEFRRRSALVADDVNGGEFRADGIRVINSDSRRALSGMAANQFDLLVTSPPYLNSFDYSDVYRPEMFVGRFVTSNAALREVRLRTLRSHVQVAWEPAKTIASDLLPPLLRALKRAELWDDRLPDMVQSYFSDMEVILRQSCPLVKPGGQAWIVVSTSAYGGIEIPVDLILADVASSAGWELQGVYVLRQMRAAGQHWAHLGDSVSHPLRESLIIVTRPGRPNCK